MITGVKKSMPKLPSVLTVNVPPSRSGNASFPVRAPAASRFVSAAMLDSGSWSAFFTTGTIRPSSSATAIPTLMSDWTRMLCSCTDAFNRGCRTSARAAARTMKSVIVGTAIPAADHCSLSRARRSTAASIVASVPSVSWAISCRLAMHPRRDDAAHAGQRDHLRRPAGLGAAPCLAAAAVTSGTTDLAARAGRHRAEIYTGGDGVPAHQRRDDAAAPRLSSWCGNRRLLQSVDDVRGDDAAARAGATQLRHVDAALPSHSPGVG